MSIFKKPNVLGVVKTKDGTELQLVSREMNLNKQIKRMRETLSNSGVEVSNPICIYNCGEYYDVEDVLDVEFEFDDDSQETGAIKFLEFLQNPVNVSIIISHSKFNDFIIGKMIENSDKYINDSVKRELVLTQDIFSFPDFVKSLPLEMRFTLFTENPYRTAENMANYKNLFYITAKRIILSNTLFELTIGYKEIDILDKQSEAFILLNKAINEFLKGIVSVNDICEDVIHDVENMQISELSKMDEYDYVIASVKQNPTPCSFKESIISSVNKKKEECQEQYNKLNAQVERLKTFKESNLQVETD